MAYLFDTDAVSEVLRSEPLTAYLAWLQTVPREDQFVSAVTAGELFKGAYRSSRREQFLRLIEEQILPAVTVLPFELNAARVFGRIRADLEEKGSILPDADLQIAATALHHDLELVTGNIRHFERIPRLRIDPILRRARGES